MEKFQERHHRNGFGIAIVLIIVGILFLGFNTGVIPEQYRPILISWEMFLIFLGALFLFRRHVVGGIVLIFIGGFFILPKLTAISGNYIQMYWPVLLILLGVILLFSRFNRRKQVFTRNTTYLHQSASDGSESGTRDHYSIQKDVSFASDELVVLDPEFEGGKVNVTFGEVKIDLRRTSLAVSEVVIEVNVSFGNIIFYVPSDWNVKLQLNSVFGGFEDKRIFPLENQIDQRKTLLIVGSTAFGGGELRN